MSSHLFSTRITLLVVAGIVLVLAGSTVGAAHVYQTKKNQAAMVENTKQGTKHYADNLKATDLAKREQASKAASKPENAAPDSSSRASTTISPIQKQSAATKYSTSSDPRSTAYSMSPPVSNPESFNIPITHNGQVTAGTAISYNATKGEKSYYGGDLILSASTITLSKNSNPRPTFTVSIPDGYSSQGPTTPWDDTNRSVFPASSVPLSQSTSWEMFAALYYDTVPTGTYTIHLRAARAAQTADLWEYHGFLTVNVVD